MSDYRTHLRRQWADHTLMGAQLSERRETGRALQTGDLVQDHPGGEIREVLEHESAGTYFERKAYERAAAARTERTGNT